MYAGEAAVSEVKDANFIRNVASFGGGVALSDSSLVSLSSCGKKTTLAEDLYSDCTHVDIKENIAIEGGGLHVSLKHAAHASYDVIFSILSFFALFNPCSSRGSVLTTIPL